MKELSIEEKTKRYDEALQRTRRWHDSNTNEGYRAIFEDIFPELKESEDEKWTPKEIIKYLKEKGDFRSCWIAWLEKQGEQKPKFRVGDTIKCKYDDRQFTIKSVDLDKGTYTYTQEGCGNDIDYADEDFELVSNECSI